MVQTLDKDIRECLRRAMRASRKSHRVIADELGARIGRRVSVESLNKWASEAESERRLAADCVQPLCDILEDDSLQRLLLGERMLRCLRLGEWLLNSKWIIEELDIKLPKGRSLGKDNKASKPGRRAARTANRP